MERKCGAKFALGFVFCYEYAMVTQVHIFVYSTQALNLVILTDIASLQSVLLSLSLCGQMKSPRAMDHGSIDFKFKTNQLS